MKKTKKALLITLLCLIIACGIAYIVLYCIYKQQTLDITYQVIDYICNKPLPVIGLSALTVGVILFKLISVIAKSKGLKYATLKEENLKLKEELAETKREVNELAEIIKKETEKAINFTKEVCDALPNKKVKMIGEKYGEERTDRSTETKEI